MLTVQQLAQFIHEELEKDAWGDIDPFLFEVLGTSKASPEDEEFSRDVQGMKEVLERVVARLNQAS